MEINGKGMAKCLVLVMLILDIAWPVSCTLRRPGGRRATPFHDSSKLLELRGLAKFAVDEYNFKQGADLQFVRLVSSEQQVVAGIMYYLVLEATSKGNNGLYEAKVWVKVWENFKSLEEFKSLGPNLAPTSKFKSNSEPQEACRQLAA
ncbi:hypothetical protein GOP47_0004002 [Adiantum capillus-veneris]|uniref:Cysteine proteinase inhibitor n=1 Tax=Adiantum capillus-veneris TaxID=13818 RepID=A0A9D4V6R9_ADICA|nr:hypothetical protein GOP47_0004002 [Adiantum capillus-veneris]